MKRKVVYGIAVLPRTRTMEMKKLSYQNRKKNYFKLSMHSINNFVCVILARSNTSDGEDGMKKIKQN